MKRTYFTGIAVILTMSVLFACGGGGGGGTAADPNAPDNVALTPSKSTALADGSDAITVTAVVTKADGAAVADGTVVTFSAPGSSAVVSPTSATCSGGNASVSVTHPAITDANNKTIVVTAAAGSKSGNMSVKFIKQPSSVDVSVGFAVAIDNLAALQFKLNNTDGATFSNTDPQLISAINAAAGSSVLGNFTQASNSNSIGLIHTTGFATAASIPIIKATYAVAAGAGLPTFSVDVTDTGFVATDFNGNQTVPQVSASNMVVISTVFDTE
jgi:adhesin/invasin